MKGADSKNFSDYVAHNAARIAGLENPVRALHKTHQQQSYIQLLTVTRKRCVVKRRQQQPFNS